MDFSLTEEHRALRDAARRWLVGRGGGRRDADGTGDWSMMQALGWFADLDTMDLTLIAEECGAALLDAPWFAALGLAGPAFRAAGRTPARPATLGWAEPAPGAATLATAGDGTVCRADRASGAVRLSGTKLRVPDLLADLVVPARAGDGIGLYLVDITERPQAVRRLSTVDDRRPLSTVELSGTPAELLVGPGQAAGVLRHTRWHALVLLAAEAVGVGRGALDLAVDHARTRRQFGRPIGAYQGVAHPLADVAAAVELARSLVYRAAWSVDTHRRAGQPGVQPGGSGSPGSGPEATATTVEEAVLTATVAARQATLDAAATAIQTLGGTGFTWEHPVHRRYRRARWIASFDTGTAACRAALADLLLGAAPRTGTGRPGPSPVTRGTVPAGGAPR